MMKMSPGRFTLRYSAKVSLGCAFLCIVAAAVWPDQVGFGCAKDMITGDWVSHRSWGAVVLWSFAAICLLIAVFGIERRSR